MYRLRNVHVALSSRGNSVGIVTGLGSGYPRIVIQFSARGIVSSLHQPSILALGPYSLFYGDRRFFLEARQPVCEGEE